MVAEHDGSFIHSGEKKASLILLDSCFFCLLEHPVMQLAVHKALSAVGLTVWL